MLSAVLCCAVARQAIWDPKNSTALYKKHAEHCCIADSSMMDIGIGGDIGGLIRPSNRPGDITQEHLARALTSSHQARRASQPQEAHCRHAAGRRRAECFKAIKIRTFVSTNEKVVPSAQGTHISHKAISPK